MILNMIKQEITLYHYLIIAAIIFVIGISGLFFNRKNLISVLVSIELMLLAININFVSFSIYLGNIVGQIVAMAVLALAAAEISVGLAIIVVYFRNRHSIDLRDIDELHG
ncbi:NADH-quinone oxidoreductase subunit NuoK [Rickettsia endosymbiont of Cardiosporidium cionae]|uniref:NADH-quinone oxidoreductase subunit NuoK n=1 Tax=Rickettsia endosymbiont of Cardiosporidium cionae TaxID=2777155 RepID=UPI001E397EF6|nr:NADH-quinone oxidoreductase subunit NuoK [Rickettsia endosymbiont of Cardiosporidium cionae]KAF8818905.1 NADH-quinone oxidoreductase subunit NuoK [Rickettsia endosymbiont of Cardiosporidium cionae]